MSVGDLLSDAETCLVTAQQRNDPGKAREAHDFVDMYFIERDRGEEEPWESADEDAWDIENIAGLIERQHNRLAVAPKPVTPPPAPVALSQEQQIAQVRGIQWFANLFSWP